MQWFVTRFVTAVLMLGDDALKAEGQLEYQVERTIKLTGVRKFVFYNYRNTALTHWTCQGINVDTAISPAITVPFRWISVTWSSSRYPKRSALPLSRKLLRELLQEQGSSQQIAKSINYGEGRCPVVPLVFKTSLGAVRFPEGSTPSLLRQSS